jgi:hypothetical protein
MQNCVSVDFKIDVRFLKAGMQFSALCVMLLLLVAYHPTAGVYYYAVMQNTCIFKEQSSRPHLQDQKMFYSTLRMNTLPFIVVWSNGDGKKLMFACFYNSFAK